MSLSGKVFAHMTSELVSARYDHGESAGQIGVKRLDRLAKMFTLASLFLVPVGYQDELGFHYGQPQVKSAVPGSVTDQNNLRSNSGSF
jgi:hypothetical protein